MPDSPLAFRRTCERSQVSEYKVNSSLLEISLIRNNSCIQVDLVDASAKQQTMASYLDMPAVFFFSELNNLFLDTLILKIYFLIMKINNFRGDLSGNSA